MHIRISASEGDSSFVFPAPSPVAARIASANPFWCDAASRGDRYQVVRPAAQLVANRLDERLEVAVAPDHLGQHLARYRLRRGENHRLDPAHPFSPADFWRQVGQFGVKAIAGSRPFCHGVTVCQSAFKFDGPATGVTPTGRSIASVKMPPRSARRRQRCAS
jgi:hypothetical protein